MISEGWLQPGWRAYSGEAGKLPAWPAISLQRSGSPVACTLAAGLRLSWWLADLVGLCRDIS